MIFPFYGSPLEKKDFSEITINQPLFSTPALEIQAFEIVMKMFSWYHISFLDEHLFVTTTHSDGSQSCRRGPFLKRTYNKLMNAKKKMDYVNEIVTTQPLGKISEKSIHGILGEEGANSWKAILQNVPEDFKIQKNNINPSQIGHHVSYIATGLNVVRALGVSALATGLYYLAPSIYASYVGESL